MYGKNINKQVFFGKYLQYRTKKEIIRRSYSSRNVDISNYFRLPAGANNIMYFY